MKGLKEFLLNEAKPNNREKDLKSKAMKFAKRYWGTVAQSTYDDFEEEFDERLNDNLENNIVMVELLKELKKKFK